MSGHSVEGILRRAIRRRGAEVHGCDSSVLLRSRERVHSPVCSTQLALKPAILALASGVDHFAQGSKYVRVVEHNSGLRRVLTSRNTKYLPHIHHRHANLLSLLSSEKAIKRVRSRFQAVATAEPGQAMTDQLAHDNGEGLGIGKSCQIYRQQVQAFRRMGRRLDHSSRPAIGTQRTQVPPFLDRRYFVQDRTGLLLQYTFLYIQFGTYPKCI
jgi:hypothetical protein